MKKLLSMLTILTMVLAMQSCNDSNGDTDMKQGLILLGYNHIYEPGSTDNAVRNKAAKYKCEFNFTKSTLELTITGAFNSDGDQISLTLEDIPFTFSTTKGYTFSVADATPTASDSGTYKVTNLSGSVISYVLDINTESRLNANTVMQISYTVDGKYEVFSVLQTMSSSTPEIHFTDCTSTATTGVSEQPFMTTDATYLIVFTSSKKANVTMFNTQFSSKMEKTTMVLKDIPVELTKDGYRLESESITPMVGDAPMSSCQIKDFRLDITDKATVANVAFSSTYNGVSYALTAQCKLIPTTTKSNK